jgi:hypothetical protein
MGFTNLTLVSKAAPLIQADRVRVPERSKDALAGTVIRSST